jgi:hypothetical protein
MASVLRGETDSQREGYGQSKGNASENIERHSCHVEELGRGEFVISVG